MRRRDAQALVDTPVDEVCAAARELRRSRVVTYSPKVFIPLTKLCRDVCHYCTFARPPRRGRARVPDARTRCSRSRARARPPAATRRSSRSETSPSCATGRRGRSWPRSAARRRSSTSRACARLVLEETGLLPAPEPRRDDARRSCAALRAVSASQGIMLETASERLSRARRAALRLARQAPGRTAGDDRGSGRGARAVHDRDPDRDRRDAGGAASRRCSRSASCTSGTATCRR